jgi:ataxin-10
MEIVREIGTMEIHGKSEEESRAKCVMFALQTVINAGMDDGECLTQAWECEAMEDALKAVTSLRGIGGAKTHGLVCLFVDACVKHDSARAVKIANMAQNFWLPLLRASTMIDESENVGGGAHLMTLIRTICCKGAWLPKLFRALSPNGAEISSLNEAILRARLVELSEDDSGVNSVVESTHKLDLPQIVYTSEQATLLHFIAALLSDKDATSYVDVPHSEICEGEQPPLLLPEGVLAFLLDTTSVVAARFEAAVDDDERRVALSIIMECVSILRSMSEREVKPHAGDTIACLAAMGLVRLILSLLAALPPPEGVGQTSKATGPAAAPKLEQTMPEELKSDVVYPSRLPWSGYRVDLIAIIGNAAFNRTRICDDVANLGGIPIVLNHTRGEEGEPYLREWALWAVRNLTQSSELARSKIADLQPQAIEESEELLSKSLGVELNRETGRPRVVRREQTPVQGDAVQKDSDDAEPAIPTNWKVTEL